jgi:glycosyltransferase involved in cell wall biosynthesis
VYDTHIDNDNFHLDQMYKKIGFNVFKNIVLPVIKRSSDGFIAVNPYAQRFLENRFNIFDSHFLPLGANIENFRPSKQEGAELRSKLRISEDDFVVITAGNINKSKKVENIIQSISNLDVRAVRLIVLGGGDQEYLESLRNLVEDLDVSNKVIFHDFVEHEDLSKFYNAADVGVWPGKLGITIIESLSCGLPIIVAETKATEFLIVNDNGISLPDTSPSTIANAIRKYAKSTELRRIHGSNARQLAEKNLSWKSIAKKSIDIYHDL